MSLSGAALEIKLVKTRQKNGALQLSPSSINEFRTLTTLVETQAVDFKRLVEHCVQIIIGPREGHDWELTHLCVTILADLSRGSRKFKEISSIFGDEQTIRAIVEALLIALRSYEPRVRENAASAVYHVRTAISVPGTGTDDGDGAAFPSQACLAATFDILAASLLNDISAHICRSETTRAVLLGGEDGAYVALDDTTGWGSLETSLLAYHRLVLASVRCLQTVITGYVGPQETGASTLAAGVDVESSSGSGDSNLRLCLCDAAHHTNRYIREATLKFIGELAEECIAVVQTLPLAVTSKGMGLTTQQLVCGVLIGQAFVISNSASSFGTLSLAWRSGGMYRLYQEADMVATAQVVADALAKGLQDEWSQLRLVAIHATRAVLPMFLDSGALVETSALLAPSQSSSQVVSLKVLSALVPRLCLNRFYSSSVGLAARKTWKDVISACIYGIRDIFVLVY